MDFGKINDIIWYYKYIDLYFNSDAISMITVKPLQIAPKLGLWIFAINININIKIFLYFLVRKIILN